VKAYYDAEQAGVIHDLCIPEILMFLQRSVQWCLRDELMILVRGFTSIVRDEMRKSRTVDYREQQILSIRHIQ
jgi:hypothetical protein